MLKNWIMININAHTYMYLHLNSQNRNILYILKIIIANITFLTK